MNINNFKKRLSLYNNNGFISIETIISSVFILMCIYLAIGFFCMIYPRVALEKEVNTLAQKAKVQGGLTDSTVQPENSDIEVLKKNLKKLGYNYEDVEISGRTIPSNINIIGVTPLDAKGDNYIKRDSKEQMVITVKVPSQNFILGPLKFFNIKTDKNKLTYQSVSQTVMSERW